MQDRHGKTVYRFDKRNCPECNQADWKGQEEPLLEENQQQVLDPRTAYQIVSILEGVIQRGTGQAIKVARSRSPARPELERFPRCVVRRFLARSGARRFHRQGQFPDARHGRAGRVGRSADLPRLHEGSAGEGPPTPFRIPQGIVEVPINPITGAVVADGTPGSILEAFKPGTEPGAGYAVSDINDVPGQAALPATATDEAAPSERYSGRDAELTATDQHNWDRHRRALLALDLTRNVLGITRSA